MQPHLVQDHIASMTTACINQLRQLANEGLRYRLVIQPSATDTVEVHVQNLTPDIDERIRRCLGLTGMQIEMVPS
ncbi:hypothetical protein [Methylobacterium nigriterrae]|uniref:hypothetical protein n=1 Tax=Methylobacterium nigriterrae TaxID=3127512 RepID=UPI003013C881